MPRAEVGVDAAPRALDDESVQERVMVIARNQGLAVHHVTVHDIRGQRSVSLDLEVDRSLRWARPMTSPTSLRPRSARSWAPPSRWKPISSRCNRRKPPAARRRRSGCERWKSPGEIAAEGGMIRDVHNVRVRETDEGEIVNFHGRVDPSLAVQAATPQRTQ